MEPRYLGRIALCCWMDDRRFRVLVGALKIFLFTAAFRPALGPTQPLI